MKSPFLTIPQVARKLRRTPSRCYQMIRARELPVVQVAGRMVVPAEAFETWLQNLGERALASLKPETEL